MIAPSAAKATEILGIFVGGLKSRCADLGSGFGDQMRLRKDKSGTQVYIKPVLVLYVLGKFAAALVAVLASFLFPNQFDLGHG